MAGAVWRPLTDRMKMEARSTGRLGSYVAAVQVVFYDRENWQVQTAADDKTVIGGTRGPEKIQRVTVIR